MLGNVVRYVVMAAALIVFGYASYSLTLIYLEGAESSDTNTDLSSMFMQNVEYTTDENGELVVIRNTSADSTFVWDYDLMLKYNSEAKGYIRQEGGPHILDYPILQHKDNDYYLEHLPNNVYNAMGSIFIDYRITEGFDAKNCIIYGHRVIRSEPYVMFGSLNCYIDSEEYGLSHPTMDIYTGYDHYKYYVFAAYQTSATGSDVYQYSFSSDESFMNYIEKSLSRTLYTFPEAGEITASDKIVTLSTCTNDDLTKRTIIQLVRREKIEDTTN